MNNLTIVPTKTQLEKYDDLLSMLRRFGSVAVAFSSGVDSTFLLYAAKEALADRVIAVTAQSCSFPKRELNEAKAFCEQQNIRHFICESEELDIEGFSHNPKNRCYLCKHELFEKIRSIAERENIEEIAEGSNLDDNGDYRPGLQAVAELGFKVLCVASALRKMISGHYPNILVSQPGTNSLSPVFPPDSYTVKLFPEKSLEWLIRQSSCYWILDFIRYEYVSMEPLQELRFCRKSFQSSFRKIFEIT